MDIKDVLLQGNLQVYLIRKGIVQTGLRESPSTWSYAYVG